MGESDRVHREHPEHRVRRGASAAQPRRSEQDTAHLLGLQRLAGNSAVSSLMVQRQGPEAPSPAPAEAAPGGAETYVTADGMKILGPITLKWQGEVKDGFGKTGEIEVIT